MIILYHSVIPDNSPLARSYAGQALTQSVFKRQIQWLANHRPIVSLDDYIESMKYPEFNEHSTVAITFDDGSGITFDCVYPILAEMNIPAAIFITTGHLNHGEPLWFNYLKALCFEDLYPSVSVGQSTFTMQTMERRKQSWVKLQKLAKESGVPSAFVKKLSRAFPLPRDISDLYGGMTYEQIKVACETDSLEIGAHTVTHPFLSQVSTEIQEEEILGSKRILSELTGRPIRYFAYPAGEYNHTTVELVKKAGYEAGFAVIPQKTSEPLYEISRTGIYSPSLFKLQLKALGVADLARRVGFQTG